VQHPNDIVFGNEPEHRVVHYRTLPDMVPADVCSACSDFETGRLVPVAFCAEAKQDAKREERAMRGEPTE